ncbi:MAG: tetratricopeptide repeat protein [Candidatus Rokubacteria bacterium]|nr:tetratricopeptide repeat protein [Candidatus Rokubacteria bacterium]
MRRWTAGLLTAIWLWPALAGAAAPLPLELPPPDLAPLIPLAAPPLDKPPVPLPEVSVPDPPHALPPLPAPPLAADLSGKPVAPLPLPRILACNPLGTFFGVASELLECGRARFQRDELEEGRAALEAAARGAGDRAVIREGRYWLAETLLRLGRYEPAERNLLLVAQEGPADELTAYATYALGWVALRLNDPARALARFDELRRGPAVPGFAPFVPHGRAVALYGLGRFEEAREAWQGLLKLSIPRPLAIEAAFWLGDTLGRVGAYKGAMENLQRFTGAGPHPLIETGILRLGWWTLAAGDALEAAKAFRWLLSAYPRATEWAWARVGLARALLALDDWPGAREEIRQLQAAAPGHPLVLPGLLILGRWAVERNAFEPAHAAAQEILALDLAPQDRAYALLLNGEAYRREGQSGEARGQFELVRDAQRGTPLGWAAALRLAQMDVEAREFARAAGESAEILKQPIPYDVRALALLLHADAAYRARDWETSAAGFRRFLSEFPGHPQAGAAALSLGWAELRRGNGAAARERWVAFARFFPADPRAPEALLLAAELAGEAGDARAKDLLDQLLARYPAYAQADVARLNRAILNLRSDRLREAREELTALVKQSPLSPFLGRTRLALGVALLALGRPEEAAREFKEALRQGQGALAHLGAGTAALSLRRWEEAGRELREARDAGTAAVSRAAEYGLVVLALNEGKRDEFNKTAGSILQSPPSQALLPPLLYVLAALAGEDKHWSEARALTLRLLTDYPGSDAADDALFRLGSRAAAGGQWTLAREAFQLLESRYPKSPLAEDIQLAFAEALFRGGALAEARGRLEAFVVSGSGDPGLPRALFLLAQAREGTGDRAAALKAYSRLVIDHPSSEWTPVARVAQGRLLLRGGRWDEARQALEQALAGSDESLAVEAAFMLGEGLRARGAQEDAIEVYLTAAYLAPASTWGHRALLGAGQSLAALKQPDAAAIVYRKLLAQPDVAADLSLHGPGVNPCSCLHKEGAAYG